MDASVALAWCFPDEGSDDSDSVLLALENKTVIVPAIWAVEVTNALLVGDRRKRIRQSEVRRSIYLAKSLSNVEENQVFANTLSNVLRLGREHDLMAYDAPYLDVAVSHKLQLATLESASQRACTAAGIKVFKA